MTTTIGRRALAFLTLLLCVAPAAGCSVGKKSILFVTSSSFAFQVDSKPPVLSIGYSRQEGTLAPVVEEGAVLPQMASFRFNVGAGASPDTTGTPASRPGVRAGVGQSFATGTAAVLLAKYLGTNARPQTQATVPDSELTATAFIKETPTVDGAAPRRARYFFGTDTTLGVKVTMSAETGGYPDSFVFGWKRKELAYVPLLEKRDTEGGKDVQKIALPSLIATVGVSAEAGGRSASSTLTQFYATGLAANYLAAQPGIREAIGVKIMDTKEYEEQVRLLKQEMRDLGARSRAATATARVLIDDLKDASVDRALDLAVKHGLLLDTERGKAGTTAASKKEYLKKIAVAGNTEDPVVRLEKFVAELDPLVKAGG